VPETRIKSRQATVDRLRRIADDHAGGYRPGLTRADALAELSATSSDPDLLAEAAAAHAMADNWYAIVAVDLLIEAGADEELIQVHIAEMG